MNDIIIIGTALMALFATGVICVVAYDLLSGRYKRLRKPSNDHRKR